MNLQKLLSFCICALLSIAAFPKDYHSAALFNLKGEVKQRVIDSSDPFARLSKKVEFTSQGSLKKDVLTYDSEGYPIGYGMNFGNTHIVIDVKYNDARQPVKVVFKATRPREIDLEFTYEYDGDRLAAKHIKTAGNISYDLVYSDEVYDANHNWTSRLVKETSRNHITEKTMSKEYTETQTIVYY